MAQAPQLKVVGGQPDVLSSHCVHAIAEMLTQYVYRGGQRDRDRERPHSPRRRRSVEKKSPTMERKGKEEEQDQDVPEEVIITANPIEHNGENASAGQTKVAMVTL